MSFRLSGDNVRENSLKPDLEAVGFLWSAFFAPLGPVLRYFGWLLFLVGVIISACRGNRREKDLFDRKHLFLIALLILWGGISTLMGADSFYLFGKGFSLPLEFVFGIWMASRVLSEPGNVRRFKTVTIFSVFMSVIWTIVEFSYAGTTDGPFSNINTLGLYCCIVLPVVFSIAVSERKSKGFLYLSWCTVAGTVFMLILSSTSSAWISSAFSFVVLIFCIRKSLNKRILIGMAAVAVVCCLLLSMTKGSSYSNVLNMEISRETAQICSLLDGGSMKDFTNLRSLIWQGAWRMIKMKPVMGWGWHMFRYRFGAVNPDIVNQLGSIPPEAHNMYVELIFSGGVLTLVLLLYIWGASMKGLYKVMGVERLAAGMFASLSGLLLFSMAGNVFASRNNVACLVWYMIGFGLIAPRLGFLKTAVKEKDR